MNPNRAVSSNLSVKSSNDSDDVNVALSLETAAIEAALADGVSANAGDIKPDNREKKSGLRRGKWTSEEEAYANRLITEFKLGLLPLTDGTTLRTFLSKLLNCDPMRISKKFVGAKCIGKQVFRRRQTDLDKMTPEQLESSRRELAELERKFMDRVVQVNRAKVLGGGGGTGKEHDRGRIGGLDDVQDQQLPHYIVAPNLHQGDGGVVSEPPQPWMGHLPDVRLQHMYDGTNNNNLNVSDQNGHNHNGYDENDSGYFTRGLYYLPPQHQQFIPEDSLSFRAGGGAGGVGMSLSESARDMLEFQRIMNSNGALASLVGHGNGNGNGNDRNACSTTGPHHIMGEGLPSTGYLYSHTQPQRMPWALHSPGISSSTTSGSDAGPPLPTPYVGGNYGTGPDSRDGCSGGGGSYANTFSHSVENSSSSHIVGHSGSLRYTSSAEWPSMNNLVVAAETIEQLGSMNSLLGGGLASGGSLGRISGTISVDLMQSIPLRAPDYRATEETADYVRYYRERDCTPADAGSSSSGARDSGGSSNDNPPPKGPSTFSGHGAERQQDVQRTAESDTVGYPIDDDDDIATQRPTNNNGFPMAAAPQKNQSVQRNDDQLSHPLRVQVPKAAPSLDGVSCAESGEGTPISAMLLANDLLTMSEGVATTATNVPSATSMGVKPDGSACGSVRPAAVAPALSAGQMGKSASVDNFWMLVGLGDLPQPDSDVLKMTLWQSGPPAGRQLGGGSTTSPGRKSGNPSLRVRTSPGNNSSERSSSTSPRITPNLLPPHLQAVAAATKQTRPMSSAEVSSTDSRSSAEELESVDARVHKRAKQNAGDSVHS